MSAQNAFVPCEGNVDQYIGIEVPMDFSFRIDSMR